jgi:UDP-glucose 4-epimerase
MTVVITGGVGFVGSNLVVQLVKTAARDIRIVDNLSVGRVEWLEGALRGAGEVIRKDAKIPEWCIKTSVGVSKIRLFTADIMDLDKACMITEGADSVVHLAAQTGVPQSLKSPIRDFEVNSIGTLNYLEACRQNGVKKFAMASSAAVLGAGSSLQTEDGPSRPLSPYGASKATGEAYCSAYHASYGINALSLRFSNVYGPHAWTKGSVVAAFCKRAIEGKAMIINGDGKQTRDFVFIRDLVGVIIALAVDTQATLGCEDIYGQPVNISSGRSTAVGEMAYLVKDIFAGEGVYCSFNTAPSRTGDVLTSAPGNKRLRGVLPVQEFTNLVDGLRETVSWFKGSWKI